ncbi:MAG: LysE family transporter [Gammaproteobacteria bacterium]|nr:LysE family transporter [Gammaproteobacteria bacterium]
MLAFAAAVFFLIITPGPGVLSAAAVGAGYGFKSGAKYIGGLWFGNLMVGLIVISGLWAVLITIPGLRLGLGIASLCYLAYLALRIASAGSSIRFVRASGAPGFAAGTLLQFINPKAYAVNTFLFSNFAFYPQSLLFEIIIKILILNAIWIPIHFTWLQIGIVLHRLELAPARQRMVNVAMAASLMLVVLIAAHELMNS